MSGSTKIFVLLLAKKACRYVRDAATKHYIDACRGHESILQSCLSYISSTRVFLEEDPTYSLMNQIAETRHGIHRYTWEHWTTHLEKYIELRHNRASPIGDDISKQLQSLLWLHKAYLNVASGTVGDLHPSAAALRGTPDVAVLLSRIFTFQDSVRSIEQDTQDPNGESARLNRWRWCFTS